MIKDDITGSGIAAFLEKEAKKPEVHSFHDGDLVLMDALDSLPADPVKYLDQVLIIACIEGCLTFDSDSRHIEIRGGDIFVGQPGRVLTNYMMSPELDCRVIAVRQKLFSRIIFSGKGVWTNLAYIKENPVITVGEEKVLVLDDYYKLMRRKIGETDVPFFSDCLQNLFSAFIYEVFGMAGNFPRMEEKDKPDNEEKKDGRLLRGDITFQKFTKVLEEGGGRIHSLEEVASKLNISPKYLSSVIRKVSGRKAYDLIRDAVTQAAEQRLRYTDKSIKEIAADLGYDNLSFFGRFIKSNLGCSPSEYRRRLESGKGNGTPSPSE